MVALILTIQLYLKPSKSTAIQVDAALKVLRQHFDVGICFPPEKLKQEEQMGGGMGMALKLHLWGLPA